MPKLSTHPGVVVGVDGSPGSKVAVQWAARGAELRNVSLTLVHVVPATAGTWLESSLAPTWMRAQRERGRQVLDEALKIAGESCQRGSAQIDCEMPSAITVPALVDLSKDADLVVVGCLGAGTLRGRHMGSVSSGLVYHAHCPVAVVHDGVQLTADAARASVLVGIDGSRESELATAIAFDEASRRKVGLVALHAWSDVGVFDSVFDSCGIEWPALRSEEDETMAERLAGWCERYPDVTGRGCSTSGGPTCSVRRARATSTSCATCWAPRRICRRSPPRRRCGPTMSRGPMTFPRARSTC